MSFPTVVIVGAPGAGKTTAARQLAMVWQRRFGVPVAHVEVDDLRHMVVPTEADEGDDPVWFEMLRAVLSVVRKRCEMVVLDGLFCDPHLLEKLNVIAPDELTVELCVPLEICLSRNRTRHYRNERLPDDEVCRLYGAQRPADLHRIDGNDIPEKVATRLMSWITQKRPQWT